MPQTNVYGAGGRLGLRSARRQCTGGATLTQMALMIDRMGIIRAWNNG